MWRLMAAAWLPVAAYGDAASGVLAMPIDLVWATERVEAVCKTKAPTVKPSNWEAFTAFRSRLGPLYPPVSAMALRFGRRVFSGSRTESAPG